MTEALEEKEELKAQAAIEYWLLYAWTFLALVIVLVLLYVFILAPAFTEPQFCTLNYGGYCDDMYMGVSGTATNVVVLLSNAQQYNLLNPSLSINSTGTGTFVLPCQPSYVRPGGAVLCTYTLGKALNTGQYVSGQISFGGSICQNTNALACGTVPFQNFVGTFNTRITQAANTVVSVNLVAASLTETPNGPKDLLTANVILLNTPVPGADTNFTVLTNATYVATDPKAAQTDSYGRAYSYINSSQGSKSVVNAMIVASFGNVDSPPIEISFEVPTFSIKFQTNTSLSGVSQTAPILTVDGQGYTPSMFPVTVSLNGGTDSTYSYVTDYSGSSTTRFAYSSIGGCGVTKQSGSFIPESNCTVTADYAEQYSLNMTASPSGDGTMIPGNTWVTSGGTQQISETPKSGCTFRSWSGTGSGSYSGSTQNPTLTVTGAITETASYRGC